MSQNKHGKEFFDTSIENNFIPMITYPTRVTETSATLIGHVFVNDKALRYYDKITPGILYSGLSDHLAVFINLNAKIDNKLSKEKPMVWIYGEKNTQKCINMIQDQDWSNICHKTPSTEALSTPPSTREGRSVYCISFVSPCFFKIISVISRFRTPTWRRLEAGVHRPVFGIQILCTMSP